MKIKKVLTNAYTSAKARKEILLGHLNPRWNKEKPNKQPINIEKIFTCKCGRSIFDHPDIIIGDHYRSMPYYGDLCPFVSIGAQLENIT